MKKKARRGFSKLHPPLPPFFLGIEGGATRTTAVLIDANRHVLKRAEVGPCNLRLLKDSQILRLWKDLRIKIRGPRISAVGAFLAGCRTPPDMRRMQRLLKSIWPHATLAVGSDMLSALSAALDHEDGIVLVCGTGSAVWGRKGTRRVQVGGWGHVGGDDGSGYWMGRETLRHIFRNYDRTASTDRLAQAALRFLGWNTVEELVQWSLEAPKKEIASLTQVLFHSRNHPAARDILDRAVDLLAQEVALAAQKIRLVAPKVALNQGIARHQSSFRIRLAQAIRRKLPGARVFLAEAEGALGAARWAARAWDAEKGAQARVQSLEPKARNAEAPSVQRRGLSLALTEQRNPRTMNIDRQSIPRLVKTMLDEESRTIPAIRTQSAAIARAIGWIVESFKRGGRLFYIGAGTSGRVGVLDASECQPTYGCAPDMVQGIMAGGWRALYQSMESAEDDADYGHRTVQDRGIGRRDVLVGIAASGSTPFVLGALEEAHRRGAKTILLTFNPNSEFRIQDSGFLKIVAPTGPEVVTGSTRLKAGTATKLILNMFTTIAMVRLGKVRSNLMVDLDPSCEKLHDRAARIYSALKKIPHDQAWRRLETHGWNLKKLLKR